MLKTRVGELIEIFGEAKKGCETKHPTQGGICFYAHSFGDADRVVIKIPEAGPNSEHPEPPLPIFSIKI